MIKLTEKGKKLYGDRDIKAITYDPSKDSTNFNIGYGYSPERALFSTCYLIATNPSELKALADLGLIEIK